MPIRHSQKLFIAYYFIIVIMHYAGAGRYKYMVSVLPFCVEIIIIVIISSQKQKNIKQKTRRWCNRIHSYSKELNSWRTTKDDQNYERMKPLH